MPRPDSNRILVVDDNKDAADSLVMLLACLGYDAHAAYDGVQALSEAARLAPEIVIMDINMPVMDGYEAARRLRHDRGTERTVLVALTAMTRQEDRDASMRAGFDYHLAKPMDGPELVTLLERAQHKE